MKKIITTLILFAAIALRAEEVTLTREQASELYIALNSAEIGFSPANTVAAADDMNALRPHVEALDKGKIAYARAIQALNKISPPAETQREKLALELEQKAAEQIKVDLVPLNLTFEEISNAKIKPATLAVIRRWLKK